MPGRVISSQEMAAAIGGDLLDLIDAVELGVVAVPRQLQQGYGWTEQELHRVQEMR